MNKIEKLIAELCPEGVECKRLGEICNILDSKRKPISKGKRIAGKYPYYGANGIQDFVQGYIFDGTFILLGEDGSVINKDKSPILNWAKGKIWVNNHAHIISEKSDIINLRYLYFFLQTVDVSDIVRGTPPKLNQENLRNIQILVPPLDVQQELVRILDSFTDLKAELQAELQARKEQYEYFRDNFYGGTFEKMVAELDKGNIKAKRLSELGTFVRGKRFVRADVVENGYPCIHYGDMYTYYGIKATETKTYIKEEKAAKLRFAQKGDVVIVGAGENKDDIGVGLAWLGESSPAVHDACFIYKHTDELDPMYISYFLRTRVYHMQIRKHVVEAKICSLASDKIGTALIPIPALEEQKRIASILDKFETLVNDLNNGLPAEIEALQEQYEYYRDKLLTFERKA